MYYGLLILYALSGVDSNDVSWAQEVLGNKARKINRYKNGVSILAL
ncbi:hypothetical protein GFV14_00570 [Candidatus Hartigia pinicola]|nr:hypothetical protein GFV14_00570 [Candidatus Hartigia pinicola]